MHIIYMCVSKLFTVAELLYNQSHNQSLKYLRLRLHIIQVCICQYGLCMCVCMSVCVLV